MFTVEAGVSVCTTQGHHKVNSLGFQLSNDNSNRGTCPFTICQFFSKD